MDDKRSEQRSKDTPRPKPPRPGDVIATPFGLARVIAHKPGIATVQMLDDGEIAYCICPMELSDGSNRA